MTTHVYNQAEQPGRATRQSNQAEQPPPSYNLTAAEVKQLHGSSIGAHVWNTETHTYTKWLLPLSPGFTAPLTASDTEETENHIHINNTWLTLCREEKSNHLYSLSVHDSNLCLFGEMLDKLTSHVNNKVHHVRLRFLIET